MKKKIIPLVLTLALPLTVAAFPGDKGNFEAYLANRIEHLTKSLNLTPEQKTKVEALFKEEDEKFKIIHDETHVRLQEILTKEQMAKMDGIKKQRHEKWQKKLESIKDQITPGQKQ